MEEECIEDVLISTLYIEELTEEDQVQLQLNKLNKTYERN